AASYILSLRLLGRRPALLAALLIALNPFQVWYAQDIRSYALWIGFSALTLTALVRAFQRPSNRSYWLAYILLAVLSAYTFYLEVFVFIAHNLYALIHIIRDRKLVKR